MKKIYKIILLLTEITFIYLIFIKQITIPCASKKIFNLSCPACGLTRAFKSLLKLDITKALNYNILSIPILIFLIIINITLVYDLITNRDETNKLFKTLGKHYISIFIILIIITIINNIKGI